MIENVYNGEINHPGFQPIRVLQHNIPSKFHDIFNTIKDLKEFTEKNKIDRGLKIEYGKLPIYKSKDENNTPYIIFNWKDNKNQIFLHETFLSYVWIICYTHLVYFNETIHKPAKVGKAFDPSTISPDLINKLNIASKLFEYGMSLKYNYTDWDMNLPNPEKYNISDKDDILKANNCFSYAMSTILLHELGHAHFKHTFENKQDKKFEIQADDFAFNFLSEHINNGGDILNVSAGALMGMGAIYLLNKNVYSTTHPDSDKRIEAFFKKLKLGKNNELKAIPCFSFQFGNLYYKRNIDIPDTIMDYDKLFEYFLEDL